MSRPNIIDLSKGWPAASLLPANALLHASHAVLTDPSLFVPALSYGDDAGYEPLRVAIAQWLQSFYSAHWTTMNRICISGGASTALACVLQVYTDPIYTQTVFMIAPAYFLACTIFEDNGFTGKFRDIPEDAEGIDIEYLERCLVVQEITNKTGARQLFPGSSVKPKRKLFRHVIYCVPTFSNPSGKQMSIRRRQQLVRLAREYNALIIADDVYDHLRWDPDLSAQERAASVIPRLVDIDHETDGGTDRPGADGFGNAISNGSFSKIIGPGLRTGWTEATEMFTRGLSRCGSKVSGGSPSQLCAVIISHMLDGGALVQHMDEVLIPSLQKRHQLITRAIKQHLEPLGAIMSGSNGGYFIWITLPAQVSAKSFAIQAASAENVVVAPGHLFEIPSGEKILRFNREIRVCYAWEREEALALGVERLGRILTTILYGVKRNRTSMRNLPDTADGVSAHFEGRCVMASLS